MARFIATALVFAFICSLILITAVSAQSNLQLELKADKTAYIVNEPLYVKVAAKNIGKSDAQVYIPLLDPETSGIVFEITRQGEKPFTWDPVVHADWIETPEQAIHLAPQESYSNTIDLTTTRPDTPRGARVPLLSKPGSYKIRCYGRRYLDSNEITLTVSEPTGTDLDALNLLKKDEQAEQHRSSLWDQNGRLRELIKLYPNSKYAPYARYFLAQEHKGPTLWCAESRKEWQESVQLLRVAANELDETTLGRYSLRMAGKTSAKLLNFADSINFLQQAFNAPGSSSTDRETALQWLGLTQKLTSKDTLMSLPVEEVAAAYGLKVESDPATRRVIITGSHVKMELAPNTLTYVINGVKKESHYIEGPLGHYSISIPMIADLLRAHYKSNRFDYIDQVTKHDAATW